MESNGWRFEWNDKSVFRFQESIFCNNVPSTSYCGFHHPGNGVVSYNFTNSGIGTLSYGKSFDYGSVHVFLNNKKLGSRSNQGTSALRFTYSTGDILRIKEIGAVINIHSLCNVGSYLENYCLIHFQS